MYTMNFKIYSVWDLTYSLIVPEQFFSFCKESNVENHEFLFTLFRAWVFYFKYGKVIILKGQDL